MSKSPSPAGFSPRVESLVSLLIALLAAVALVLRYALVLAPVMGPSQAAHATLRFFSFFTVLSNFLVLLTSGVPLLGGDGRAARFFASARVRGAVALYIAVTAGVYIVLLVPLWDPQGTAWVADVLLHYWVPALYLGHWLASARAPRPRLKWSDALRWLAFPGAYLFWTLLRGSWLGEYPYPFVNVSALGMAAVLRNALGLLVLFVGLGLLLVGVDKLVGRRA